MLIKRFLSNGVASVVLGLALLGSGCMVSTINPDGTTQVSEPDYRSIELMSTATIAAWAAAQKDGISKQDAQVTLEILKAIHEHTIDGSPIVPEAWAPEIQKNVPERYQALAMILVALTAHELDKYNLNGIVPEKDTPAYKVMESIIKGVRSGLAPYLLGYEWNELNAFPAGYSKV